MATLDTPLNGEFYPLWKRVLPTDTTFQIQGRFTSENAGTYTVGKHIFGFNMGNKNKSKQETFYMDVSSNPTLVDSDNGVYEYTIADISHRGIQSDNTVVPPTKSSSDERKTHEAGALVGIVISSEYQQQLTNDFTAGTTTNTAEAGEDIEALDSVSLHTDGKLYEYHSTNYPNLVGAVSDAYSTGATATYTTFGGVSTGHSGLTVGATQYAEDTGTITETSSTTTTMLGTAESATTIRIAKAADSVTEFNDNEFKIKDNSDATKIVEFQASGNTTAKTTTFATSSTDNETVTFPDGGGSGYTVAKLSEIGLGYGDGSDGALDTTSAQVDINLDTLTQYSSMIIHTNTLSTTQSDGVMIVKCQGDCTISDSGYIDLSGKGAAGGAAVSDSGTDVGTAGTDGTNATATWILDGSTNHKGLAGAGDFGSGEYAASGGSGGASASAGGASNAATAGGSTAAGAAASTAVDVAYQALKNPWSLVGAGGGSGGIASSTNGSGTVTSGAGGAGGAGLILMVGGNLTLTTATSIDASGADGGAGTVDTNQAAGGGGGGGGGGVLVIVKGTITGDTTKIDVSGGSGGAGTENQSSGTGDYSNGGSGGNGISIIQADYLSN
jgi:hypothetical protein